MNLQQLHSFLAVAETGSFRRAAALIGTPQPTLSARIKMLEQTVGADLFDRAKHGARLTQAGLRFRHHAETAISALERGRAVARLPSGTTGTLSLGLQNYLISGLGQHLISSLPKDLALRVEPDYSDALVRQVASGLLDAAVVFVPRLTTDLEIDHVGSQEVLFVSTPGRTSSRASALEGYIQVYWGEDFLELQTKAFDSRDLPRVSVGSPALALELILTQGGSAYLERQMIKAALASGQLEIDPSKPIYRRPVYLVRAPGARQPELEQVRKLLSNWFEIPEGR